MKVRTFWRSALSLVSLLEIVEDEGHHLTNGGEKGLEVGVVEVPMGTLSLVLELLQYGIGGSR